jgi:PHD-finger
METEASETIAGDGGTEGDPSAAALAGNSNHSTEDSQQEQEHDPSGSSISLVPRKFLCNAPRPDQWESYGDAVLNHLGRKKARGVLTKAVAKIRSLHSISPKAGPGRKSNAVHALLFYEYLLDRAGGDGEEDEEGGGGGGGDDDDDDSNNGDDDASEDGVGQERKFPTNKEVDDPLAAFTDEEFIAHHKHVCEVCEDAPSKEPLVLCSTCRLAFHIPCSRPVLEGGLPPPDDERWRCSYCVLATEPKNTKPRRVSAAAVRLMARCVESRGVMPRFGTRNVRHLSHTPLLSLLIRIRNQHKRHRGGVALLAEGGTSLSSAPLPGADPTDAKPLFILRRGKRKAPGPATSPARRRGNSSQAEPADGRSTVDDEEGSQPAGSNLQKNSGTAPSGNHRVLATATSEAAGEAESVALAVAAAKDDGDGKTAVADGAFKTTNDESDDDREPSGDKVPGTPTSSSSPRRRSLELQRLGSSVFSPGSTGEGGEALGKRVRKQPTLYNPQVCPARQWKSDEVVPTSLRSSAGSSSSSSSSSSDDENEGGDEGASAAESGRGGNESLQDSTSRDLRRGGHGSGIWCNFCFDDPGIKVRGANTRFG